MTSTAGFTVVLCGGPRCATGRHAPALAALRRAVQSSRLGMLVVSGCSLGRFGCALRSAGPVLVVQPSDASRRPVGPALRVGPLLDDQDVAAVEAWVRGGRFDADLLPAHLVSLQRTIQASVRN